LAKSGISVCQTGYENLWGQAMTGLTYKVVKIL